MTETKEMINEIERTEETKVEKPYEFRRLQAEDIFPMFAIIKKIGIKEFKTIMGEGDDLKKLISLSFRKNVEDAENGNFRKNVEDAENGNDAILETGLSVAMDVVDIICGNLPKCENEIFAFLARTSNLKENAIRKLDFATFFMMIVDFVKKEEFKDFFKAVSKLF